MKALHRIVLVRLLIAWLVISLLASGTIFLIEISKFRQAIVALVSEQVVRLAPEGLDIEAGSAAEQRSLVEETRQFMQRSFVSVVVYDRRHRVISSQSNQQYRAIEQELKRQGSALPHGDRTQVRRITLGDSRLLQIMVPLPGRAGGVAGYFEGSFVIDDAARAGFIEHLQRTMGGILLAIFATMAVLYPVIISLNRSVVRASEEILRGNLEIASVLGTAIAKRDSDTGDHNYRVALYAIRLGELLGIDGQNMRNLILGSYLHDVGKIGIPDSILLKPGRLTEAEFEIMRTHVSLGAEIIDRSDWLQSAREIVAHHHEKFDGSGYLNALKGKEIPLNARIFSIVDVFDALTSRRPYKEPMTVTEALAIIERDAGTHFDPELVAAFREMAAVLHAQVSSMEMDSLHDELSRKTGHYFLGRHFPIGHAKA